LLEEFQRKLEVAERLRCRLSDEEAKRAEKDPHARRLPRPCGLTIHTGVNCSYNCIYCYIRDMGFSGKPKPYDLSGIQLAYALAINPAVALGKEGSLLAFGSVTEPFMPESRERTMEYLSTISQELGNPIQLSTKAYLSEELAAKVKSSCRKASFLVTIVTLTLHEILEPGAPPPEKRYDTVKNLRGAGVHVSLFLRPILPGQSLQEFRRILEEGFKNGALGVVLGSMRVTERIVNNLRKSGFPYVEEILKRLPEKMRGNKQITLQEADLKKEIAQLAREIGLKVYPSACAANIEAHNLSCAACRHGPCGDPENLPSFDLNSIAKLAEKFKIKISSLKFDGFKIIIKARGDKRSKKQFREFVKASTKREVIIG